MALVTYPHIEIAEDGRAWIAGKTVRVTQVVLDYLAHHWSAEEIHRQHPDLTRGEIHFAFAYYFDHQQELDQKIDRELAQVDRIQSQTYNPSLQERLRQVRETK